MGLIMLVDDSATERAYCAQILRPLGHRVVEYADGDQCLEHVREVNPDLIILDVVMPGKNGFETCRTLKKDPETKAIPVVMLTSKSGESDIRWGARQGADEYIVKPASEADLIGVVKKYVAK